MNVLLRYSTALKQRYRGLILGIVSIDDVDPHAMQRGIAPLLQDMSSEIAASEVQIARRIGAFEELFAMNGFACPLGKQLEHVRKGGLPQGNPFVQALLLSEMTTGLLMGAQNRDSIEGDLLFDLAEEGETYTGMRSEIRCHTNEIVLRDAKAVIASLFLGPDQRTKLTKQTSNLIVFVFSAPGIDLREIQESVRRVRQPFEQACAGIISEIYNDGVLQE